MRSGRLALLVAAGLSVGACGVTDAVAPPESGPCEITTLDPGAPDASFASGAACVIVAWDTTRFPSALTADGGIRDAVELVGAAEQAGYLEFCALDVFPVDSPQQVVADFVARFGSLAPGARQWAANLFLLDHHDGAGEGYCREWIGVP